MRKNPNKNLEVRCFAGIDSTATGYDIVQSFKTEDGDRKFIRTTVKGRGLHGFYRRSEKMYYGFPSTSQSWTIKLAWPEYARLFRSEWEKEWIGRLLLL